MSVKNKALIIVFFLMAIVSGVFLFVFQSEINRRMDETLDRYDARVASIYGEILYDTETHFQGRFRDFINNRAIVSAFSRRDRKALLRKIEPLLDQWSFETPRLKFVHFYTPETRSFLRTHRPDLSGDDLSEDRVMIQQVNRTRQELSGLESGKSGVLYRLAFPVYQDGVYLGVIEFALDPTFISEKIARYMKVKSAIVIHRDYLNKIFLEHHELSDYPSIGEHIILETNDPIFVQIPSDAVLEEGRTRFPFHRRVYSIHAGLHLRDYSGRIVGDILTAQDVTYDLEELDRVSFYSIVLVLFLLMGSMLLLHFGFKKLIFKLEYGRARLKTITDNIGEGLYTTDSEGRVTFVNSAALQILGYDRSDLTGKDAHMLFHGEHDAGECPVLKAVKEKNSYKSDAHILIKKNNETINVMMTATPVVRKEDVIGAVVLFTDITEQKKNEQEMRNFNNRLSERVKEEVDRHRIQEKLIISQSRMAAAGQLVGLIAHQWRQPLNAMHILAQDTMETFQEGKLDKKTLEKSVEGMLQSISFITGTLDTFRDLFTSGNDPEHFNPVQATLDMVSLLSFQMKNHGISLEEDPETLFSPPVIGFPNEFKQAILSLFTIMRHRIKYCRSGMEEGEAWDRTGRINATTEWNEEFVTLRCRDRAGCISLTDLEKWQNDERFQDIEDLPRIETIRTIIENMGGFFTIEPTEEGLMYSIRLNRADPFFEKEEE